MIMSSLGMESGSNGDIFFSDEDCVSVEIVECNGNQTCTQSRKLLRQLDKPHSKSNDETEAPQQGSSDDYSIDLHQGE